MRSTLLVFAGFALLTALGAATACGSDGVTPKGCDDSLFDPLYSVKDADPKQQDLQARNAKPPCVTEPGTKGNPPDAATD